MLRFWCFLSERPLFSLSAAAQAGGLPYYYADGTVIAARKRLMGRRRPRSGMLLVSRILS